MICTLLAFVLATLYVFVYEARIAVTNYAGFDLLLILMGGLVLTLFVFVQAMATTAVQRAQRQVSPRLAEIFQKDRALAIGRWGIGAFVILSVGLAIESAFTRFLDQGLLFAVWLVFFGLSVDLLLGFQRRVNRYSNPATAIELMGKIPAEGADLSIPMEALSETTHKGLESYNISLARLALAQMLNLNKNAVEQYKDGKLDANTLRYLQGGLYESLISIFDDAAMMHEDGVCSDIATFMGKAILLGMDVDQNVASMAAVFMGRMAEHDALEQQPSLEMKMSVIITEVAKALIDNARQHNRGFRDPMTLLINHLEDMEKEKFARDKDMDVSILRQPFQELKTIFGEEVYAALPDTPTVMSEVERVLSEFSNLELVLRRVDAPEASEDES